VLSFPCRVWYWNITFYYNCVFMCVFEQFFLYWVALCVISESIISMSWSDSAGRYKTRRMSSWNNNSVIVSYFCNVKRFDPEIFTDEMFYGWPHKTWRWGLLIGQLNYDNAMLYGMQILKEYKVYWSCAHV